MKEILIQDIDGLADVRPLYILVAGGIAVGKNHIIRRHISKIDTMDVDDVMEELNYSDYNGDEYRHAMSIISDRIHEKMNMKESFIAMGTASNLSFTINRLLNAKLQGYTTLLLHIHAPYDLALYQNDERRRNNKRFVKNEDLHRIEITHKESLKVVTAIKNTDLVDYFTYVFNDRKI